MQKKIIPVMRPSPYLIHWDMAKWLGQITFPYFYQRSTKVNTLHKISHRHGVADLLYIKVIKLCLLTSTTLFPRLFKYDDWTFFDQFSGKIFIPSGVR